eukprot:4828365-Prymnesium_polylepis.2
MKQIKAVGFDLDYTLAEYIPETFDVLAYDGAPIAPRAPACPHESARARQHKHTRSAVRRARRLRRPQPAALAARVFGTSRQRAHAPCRARRRAQASGDGLSRGDCGLCVRPRQVPARAGDRQAAGQPAQAGPAQLGPDERKALYAQQVCGARPLPAALDAPQRPSPLAPQQLVAPPPARGRRRPWALGPHPADAPARAARRPWARGPSFALNSRRPVAAGHTKRARTRAPSLALGAVRPSPPVVLSALRGGALGTVRDAAVVHAARVRLGRHGVPSGRRLSLLPAGRPQGRQA